MSARSTGKGAAFYQSGGAAVGCWGQCQADSKVQGRSGCKGGAALLKGEPSKAAPKGVSRGFCAKCERQLKRDASKTRQTTKATPKAKGKRKVRKAA